MKKDLTRAIVIGVSGVIIGKCFAKMLKDFWDEELDKLVKEWLSSGKMFEKDGHFYLKLGR